MEWFLYVLWSPRLQRSYVGVTLDIGRRLEQHNGEQPGGARATRAGRPWQLVIAYGPFEDRSSVQAAEHLLKRRRGAARWTWGDVELKYPVAVDQRMEIS